MGSGHRVLLSSLLMRYLIYRRVVGATLPQAVGGIVAFAALSLVITIASLKASTGRPATWHRTGKFRPNKSGWRVLRQVLPETTAAADLLRPDPDYSCCSPSAASPPCSTIAVAIQGCLFLTATAVAFTADRAITDDDQAAARTVRPTTSKNRWCQQPDWLPRRSVGQVRP